MRINQLTLGLLFVVASFAFAPSASAQWDNDISDPFCDATMSGDQCMAGWESGTGTSGSGEVTCPQAKNYDTCIKNCDCEWGKAKNKCKMSPFCLDIAKSEHDACTGKCLTDYN